MYYVVHKFPNLSRIVIHLGIHAHPIAKGKCRKSFKEMKNMVVNEVYYTPIITTLAIVLLVSKTFFSRHSFNEDGEGSMELLKGKKLNQTLLKFVPLCSFNICNLIISLKNCLGNSGSIGCILKLKALYGYDYIQDNCFPGQRVGEILFLFKTSIDGASSEFELI